MQLSVTLSMEREFQYPGKAKDFYPSRVKKISQYEHYMATAWAINLNLLFSKIFPGDIAMVHNTVVR